MALPLPNPLTADPPLVNGYQFDDGEFIWEYVILREDPLMFLWRKVGTSTSLLSNVSANSITTNTLITDTLTSNTLISNELTVSNTVISNNITVNTSINIAGTLLANNSTGTSGQTLYSNSSGGIYWGDITGGNGYTGSQGDIGYTGSFGFGYTGSAGGIGETGYQGSQGDVGYQGSTGDLGNVGYTGSTGDQGSVGYQGSTGDQGSVGYQGSEGNIGYSGSVGYKGSQGNSGETGFTGSIGDQGTTGFTGSTGDQGEVGYTGSIGDQGFVGYQGSEGFQGSEGNVGYTGSTGDQGNIGYRGSEGYKGSEGNVGYTGSVGVTGSVGYKGSVGDKGEVGYTGSTGDQGSVGYQGSTGLVGGITYIYYYLQQTEAEGKGYFRVNGYPGYNVTKIWIDDIDYYGFNANNLINSINDSTNPSNKGTIYIQNQRTREIDAAYRVLSTTQKSGYVEISVQVLHSVVNLDNDYVFYLSRNGDLGYTGSQGVTGFNGSRGYTGSLGYVGSTGVGYTGSIGIGYVGSAGNNGETGYTGSEGNQGTTGFTGSQGDQGNVGYVGSAGNDGSVGYTGSIGIGYDGSTGFVGSQGDTGYTGSTGIGYDGSQGDTGYTGSTGIGYDGSTGFVGSQGDTGYTGSIGIGYTGSAGTGGGSGDGYTGSLGYTGSAGISGYDGSVGYTGSAGISGYDGSVGYTGSFGTTGYVGSAGYNGSVGYTGSAGIDATFDSNTKYTFANTITFTNSVFFTGSNVDLSNAHTFVVPTGNTGSEPSIISGAVRYNTDTNALEFSNTVSWTRIGAAQESFTAGDITSGSLTTESGVINLLQSQSVTVQSGISVGNTTVNTSINAVSMFSGNTTANSIISYTQIGVSNTTANSYVTPFTIFTGNTSSNAMIDLTGGKVTLTISDFNITSTGNATFRTTTNHGLQGLGRYVRASINGLTGTSYSTIVNGIQNQLVAEFPTANSINFKVNALTFPSLKITSYSSDSSGYVTFNTATNHGLFGGANVTIKSVTDTVGYSTYNFVANTIYDIPSANTFRIYDITKATTTYTLATTPSLSVAPVVFNKNAPSPINVTLTFSTPHNILVNSIITVDIQNAVNGASKNGFLRVYGTDFNLNGSWTVTAVTSTSVTFKLGTIIVGISQSAATYNSISGNVTVNRNVPTKIAGTASTIAPASTGAITPSTGNIVLDKPIFISVGNTTATARITPTSIFVGSPTVGSNNVLIDQAGIKFNQKGSFLQTYVDGTGIGVASLDDEDGQIIDGSYKFFANSSLVSVGNGTSVSSITANTISSSHLKTGDENFGINISQDRIEIGLNSNTVSNTIIDTYSAYFPYTVSVGDVLYANSINANGSVGEDGQVLASNGTALYWKTVSGSFANASSETFVADGTQNTFTLSSAATSQNNFIVTLDGLIAIPSTHYNISGTTLSFTSPPYTNTTIEVRNFESLVGFKGYTGSAGYIGYDGYTGSQGIAGEYAGMGYTGSTGYVGSQGNIGYTGSAGYVGSTGNQGTTGYTGSIGSTGYDGSQGNVGYVGSTGNQGTTGFTGSEGYQGSVGFTGSQGNTGFTGSTGDQGFIGSVGYTGSQGLQGNTGISGAVGFTGSIGSVGYTGSQGLIGYSGSVGFTGSIGSVGYNGSQGLQGNTGISGAVGYTGSQGNEGFVGSVGYVGSQGTIGFVGSLGYAGSAGINYQGSVGYQGSAGIAGASTSSIRQTFTGNGTNTVFTVAGGYNAGQIDIFLNGVKLNQSEVNTSSGTTFTISSPPPSGAVIEALSTFGSFDSTQYVNTTANYTLTGNITFSGLTTINYSGSSNSSLAIAGMNTRGGAGYHDFLMVRNANTSATNPNKWFRITSTGTLEILNSAYSAVPLSLTDSGGLNVSGSISINGKIVVNGPAFSAYQSSSQSIPTDVLTKVTFDTEDYDTNSNFASSRFTPTVEGYYQLSAAVRVDSGIGTGERMIVVYKNGSEYLRAYNTKGSAAVGDSWFQMEINVQVYANGTGDYFEIYMQHGAGANRNLTAARAFTRFQGCMMRGA